MTCPNCQQPLREGAQFCTNCGARTSVERDRLEDSSPTVAAGAAAESEGEARTLVVDGDPFVGRVLDGKYELTGRIGEGGMGAVYRARRVHIGDEVAVKILHPRFVTDEAAVERFRREARAAAQLHHPNIVTIHDYGEARGADDVAYIVMELVNGASLRELLKKEGRLDPARAVALMRDICAGVGAAHRRHIVHRDLKPDNIIALAPDEDRERETVRVVDFGIAKLRDLASDLTLTQAGAVVGTPYYMSPEQCRGESLDSRADVYSLGAMLYEMLAGAPPFTAASVTGVIAKHLTETPPPLPEDLRVPASLQNVIMRALAKDPSARQADASEFAREIASAIEVKADAASGATENAQTTHSNQANIAVPTPPAFPAVSQPVAVTPSATSPAPQQQQTAPQTFTQATANQLPPATFASSQGANNAGAVATTPQKRKSRAPLVIGLFVLLLIVAGGVGLLALFVIRQQSNERRPGVNQNNARVVNINTAATPTNSNVTTKPNDEPISAAMQSAEGKLLANELLTVDDLAALSTAELHLLSNAPYARYGRSFENANIKRYFQSRSWYKERNDFDEDKLTDTDHANIELIKVLENGGKNPKVDESAVRKDVRKALDGWADSTHDRDLDAHMEFYADTLDTFYLKQKVPAAQVRADRARAFDRYDEMDVKLDHVEIKPDATGTRAVVTLDKTWEFSADDRRSKGSVKQMLWLAKSGARWLITGERDMQVYYTNSEDTP